MAQRLSIGASLKAPTCRSLARGRSCRFQQQQPSVLFSSEQRRQTNGPSQRRYAVTAASPTVKQSIAAGEISSQGFSTSPYGEDREVLEGLRSVQRLLNRNVGGPSVWDERLSHAQLDLEAGRSIRIGVYGEPSACPRELVDALVIDPLRDDSTIRSMLEERMDHGGHVYQFRHADKPAASSFNLELPSTWLEQISADIVEVNSIEEDAILSNLLRADLLLLVVDPIRLLNTPHLECIGRSLVRRKSTHIAVNGHLPSSCTHAEIEARLRDQCRQFAPGSSVPAISFVNSSTAWSAQTLLMGALQSQQESSASRTLAFEKFQTEFLASRLGQLQSSVAETISRQQPSSRQTAVVTTQLALDYIHETVTRDRHTIREATKAIERLGDATDGIVSRANSLIRDENSSAHAMSSDPFAGARSRVLHDLRSRLSFFNLIALGRADDVRPILDRAVESDADSDVMLALAFNGGRLSSLQEEATRVTAATVASLSKLKVAESPNRSILTSVLRNQLDAFAATIPTLTAADLTTPLRTRRQHIATATIPQLRSAAFKASLLSYTGAFGGACMSWAAAVPPVELVQPVTSLGVGLLSIVSSLSLGQRLWHRAQRSFWKDWDRTALSAREDISNHSQDVIDSVLVALPRFAAQQLQILAADRHARLDVVESEIATLREQI